MQYKVQSICVLFNARVYVHAYRLSRSYICECVCACTIRYNQSVCCSMHVCMYMHIDFLDPISVSVCAHAV